MISKNLMKSHTRPILTFKGSFKSLKRLNLTPKIFEEPQKASSVLLEFLKSLRRIPLIP